MIVFTAGLSDRRHGNVGFIVRELSDSKVGHCRHPIDLFVTASASDGVASVQPAFDRWFSASNANGLRENQPSKVKSTRPRVSKWSYS
jgi:hypothetical protein